jgi:ribosomal protein S18 acetylase RimI-like enzyme
MFTIRRISADDGMLLRDIRLRALSDSPLAFGSTHAKETAILPEQWHERASRASKSPDGAIFLALQHQACRGIIGCFAEEDAPGNACIVSMWVAPEARRGGLGVQLMQTAEMWAREQGFAALSLDVTEGNAPAIALYERCGFQFTGEWDRYPNDRSLRELFMLKRL